MRPYPNLIHPVPIQVQQIDKPSTFWDSNAREPVQQAARKTTITLYGQVDYQSSRDRKYTTYGYQDDEVGYVLFRQLDLDSSNITIQIGDRITKIGYIEHDAYITRLQPTGHYPEFGNTLLKCYFSDKQPTKQRR